MKILILCENYPSLSNLSVMAFVHTRNKFYLKNNVKIEVLSFSTNKDYYFEGVPVFCLNTIKKRIHNNNNIIVLSHAPNLKHHIKFIVFYLKKIKKIIFFIHGHEILKINKVSPKPYNFLKSKWKYNIFFRIFYDNFKLFVLKFFFLYLLKKKKVYFIFVSKWIKDQFLTNISINYNTLAKNSTIISNACNHVFHDKYYFYKKSNKKADFITIRPFDKSHYSIDLVVRLAEENPNFTFHVFGKGDFFKFYTPPDNLKVFYNFFSHSEIPEILNCYRFAYMPTRLDSQGVMVCEMATYGIPVITSDLSICRETLANFPNVQFIKNDTKFDLNKLINHSKFLTPKDKIRKKFNFTNTILKEISIINHFL